MTTLYKPVKIESAEQAEALPLGAPVWRIHPYAFTDDRGYIDTISGKRMVDTDTGRHFAADMVGWTALVPIEAEEEHAHQYARRAQGDMYTTPPRQELPGPARRLVTPWEPA